MTIIAKGTLTSYEKIGSGSSFAVLLHGWGSDKSSLRSLAQELASTYTIVIPDIPGFGESERPSDVWGLAEYAEWLAELLTKLQVKKLTILLGHSNGGALAIKAVSSGLVNPQKLVLLGASGIRSREKGKKMLYTTVAKTGKVATKILPTKFQHKVRNTWYKKIGSELYDRPGMEAIFKKVTSEDLVVDASMISVPTLLIYGSEDRATPPLFGSIYHEAIENSEFHIVDGVGHYSFIDAPDRVLTLVRTFIRPKGR